eukprot:TRINITY_DN748_c0_g1_i1.p1 TRINITY_DN748_c0_g1~~TRINITY_DN748_c0_g1_i1.p1  ORF type:complete len:257 (+),score=115.65 TRINITY_DN748_c0_g1_i1:109-879(+)
MGKTKKKNRVKEESLETISELSVNEKGQKIKITKQIAQITKEYRVNKRVLARHANWKKFGECADATGPEEGITTVGDETSIELPKTGIDTRVLAPCSPTRYYKFFQTWIICRICGARGDHWTADCKFAKTEETRTTTTTETPAPVPVPAVSNIYIPPSLREPRSSSTTSLRKKEDYPTIRISSLPEDIDDNELDALCSNYGSISRLYMARDQRTKLSKGFAFISYYKKEDAERALLKLEKYGYNNVILHAEWANRN